MNEKPRLVKRLHSFYGINPAQIESWQKKNQREYIRLFQNKKVIPFKSNVSLEARLKHLALVELPYCSDETNLVFKELFSSLTEKGIVPLDGRTVSCVLAEMPHIASDIFLFVDQVFIMGSTTQYKNRERVKPVNEFVSFFRENEESDLVVSNKTISLFLEEKIPHTIIAFVSDDFIRQQEAVSKKKQFAL